MHGASISYDNDEVLNGYGPVTVTRNNTNGLLTATTVGSITHAYATYNGYGELTDYKSPATSPVYEEAITRDGTLGGRILTKAETISGTTVTHTYTYDTSNRLMTDGATTFARRGMRKIARDAGSATRPTAASPTTASTHLRTTRSAT